ncbi:UHRF1-binding protein 1-like [Macleaya cordata]|uniref:UHRF1-binding protein 1-like n=1 Tax=Macleaya cordata TaxID=56857 RepID=A0A200QL66_MACCD|nr:UHRF1-binding protein 1-like [Macleaya cordata]
MESILARALEYTLKYWLKSFSRDQFKLQGRTVQLSNLDINGEALHASVGLPPALNVATAKVGKLEIKFVVGIYFFPSVGNVQIEPIVVQIDRLDLVLEENSSSDTSRSSTSSQSSTSSSKGSGYGFADKIADGMTLEVGTVNLLIETRGGAQNQGGATWASPLASITIRNLLLYTTNENWEVVNLKEARDFSNNKKCIYVFKKLEWESLSIDLLPHPDMFTDANLTCSNNGGNKRDDDGAKRVFFGGERLLEGISGQANITVQRTQLNSPLGLEVQLHVPEAVCPTLSEPGLRAVLRFMTGLYVCINRDVNPSAQQRCTEAAGRSLVSIVVDHIFLCIKDNDFQLELLMQSLFFSRASVSDGGNTKNLSRITVAGLFLRDTFSHPPCTLIQPSMQAVMKDSLHVPDFGRNFCPPIYPLGDLRWQLNEGVPLVCLHSLQIKPTPAPPSFASQTVIDCQPLMINLQEESCLRIASFLADGIVVNPGTVLPDFSVNSLEISLREIDLTVPLDAGKLDNYDAFGSNAFQSSFAGARLHVKDLFFSESPEVKLRLLNLDKDPACFCLWEDQPVDASQIKWKTQASQLSLSLETGSTFTKNDIFSDSSSGLWKCVELLEVCIEAAMVTADGSPLVTVPPPGGIVRIGVSCQQYLSNTSVEQLFFVLDLYGYFGRVAEKISKIGKSNREKKSIKETLGGRLIEKFPSDTAVILAMKDLQLRFLESSSMSIEGMPLVLFSGEDLFIKVCHRTLGGAIAVSSSIRWESVQVDCVDEDGNLVHKNGVVGTPSEDALLVTGNGYPHMRTVFWIDNGGRNLPTGTTSCIPFLEISMVQVIPYDARDMESHSLSVSAKVGGVRLGGGMNYTEALLHRFGILGPDGGPSEGLSKGLKYLSTGPLSKLLRASPIIEEDQQESGSSEDEEGGPYLDLGRPDDVDVSIELKNWLFALEGAQERAERWWFHDEDVGREDRCWHTMFQSLLVKAKSSPKNVANGTGISLQSQKNPVELVTVGVEGLQAIKPQTRRDILEDGVSSKGIKGSGNCGGVNLEVRMVSSENNENTEIPTWVVENVKFSIKQPIEAVATKEELEHLAGLCKSEGDSMGRIAAGILRLLKLDGSLGKAAIDQLSNLGSDGLDKIFTPEKLSRRSSTCSIGFTPSSNISESPHLSLESTVASLESAVLDSQSKCLGLIAELGSPEFSVKQQHLSDIKQLQQKLESMQILLTRLRTQI